MALLVSATLWADGPHPVQAAGMLVNTLVDADPPAADGLCSLREAISNANSDAAVYPDCPAGIGADTITFSLSGTILLAAPLPEIANSAGLIVDGSGQSVTVSGNNAVRPFAVGSGAVASLRHLTIVNGRPAGLDLSGGIYNNGTLTVTDSTISGNLGLSILNLSGTVTVTNSTLSRHAGSPGGGIYNSGGSLTVTNSTVSGNSASSTSAGGIYNVRGSLSLTNSTVSENSSVKPGGGIANDFGTLTVSNSILAGNTAGGAGSDCRVPVTTIGPNLIGDPAGCTLTGTPPITGDPRLARLAANGGLTQTHALLPGSPAIDAGDDVVCAAAPVDGTDQRGVSRPQGAHCDLGSFELQPSVPVVGGKNLRITTGSIALAWDAGAAQLGYTLLQYNAVTETAAFVDLPADATSYSHGSAQAGVLYCYALAAKGSTSAILGLSDLVCAMRGIEAGTGAPGGFGLSLNQTTTATLVWATPAERPDSYLLQSLPLDGSPATQTRLPGGTVLWTQRPPTAGECYQLVAYRAAAWGSTDVVCGIPGFTTLDQRDGASLLAAIQERARVLRGLLSTAWRVTRVQG